MTLSSTVGPLKKSGTRFILCTYVSNVLIEIGVLYLMQRYISLVCGSGLLVVVFLGFRVWVYLWDPCMLVGVWVSAYNCNKDHVGLGLGFSPGESG